MEDFHNSINDFNEAKQVIPGGVNSPVRAFSSVGGSPVFIQKGEGYKLIDVDGNAYIDFVQSWGPLIFGHTDKDIESSVTEAIKMGLSFGAPTERETALVKEILPCYNGIEKMRLVNSGTEATMSAIRLARAYSGKDDIIKFDGCYHGHSDSLLVSAGSGCATFGNPSSPGVPKDFSSHTLVARYNDIDSLKSCIEQSKNVACVIIEPIAGNMGLVPANEQFLHDLREICDKHKIVLILDEVMSGFRAGLSGVQSFVDIEADMATFGKVIGGGMPLAAFGGKTEIMDMLSPQGGVYQAGTLSGNPIATAAGLATLRKIKKTPNLYKNLEGLATMLTQGLQQVAQKHNIALQTNVRGSMFGFFFNDRAVNNFEDAQRSDITLFAQFHSQMLKRGVYFACSQFESGFICAPMDKGVIESAILAADEAFAEMRYNNAR